MEMADNTAENAEQKEKLATDYPDNQTGVPDETLDLDDSKAKFIPVNGRNSLEDTKVEITGSVSETSFTGLGKEELKKFAEDPFWVRLRWILFVVFWVGWIAMLVSAIVIIVLAPRCPKRPDQKWYHKDVAYNIYSKSFLDGDASQDGYGDLEGIAKKEDYFSDVNAKTLWLSAVFKTDLNNDRAIVDHKMLDEKFGTIDALKAFCKKLLKTGKRVILDLIPNQTSRNHTWFMKSRQSEDKYADYYVWTDNPPTDWVREDGSNMWVLDRERQQYFLSQFEGTADLDLTNEDVIEEFKEIIQFWTRQGISGFHINDLEYLTENKNFSDGNDNKIKTRNYPDNTDVIDALRRIVDGLDNKPGREKLLFGTVTSATVVQLKMYLGKGEKRGLHMTSVVLDDLTSTVSAENLQMKLEPYVNITTNRWLGWRLSTALPGSERAFSWVGQQRMIIAHALQALLPGSSLPYYGDEIAMDSGTQPQMKTVTPMQWSKGPNAGFTSGSPWLDVNKDFRMKNMDRFTAQLGDNDMMDSFQAINQLRTNESLQFGKTNFCSSGTLLAFARNADGFESYLVVANLGQTTAHKFAGQACVASRKTAKVVFRSTGNEHYDTNVNFDSALRVTANEVIVLKMAA